MLILELPTVMQPLQRAVIFFIIRVVAYGIFGGAIRHTTTQIYRRHAETTSLELGN